jgi:hypothetical protein
LANPYLSLIAPPKYQTITETTHPERTTPTLWSQVSMATAEPEPLTAREAASGLLGSISLTCWFFVLVCLIYLLLCSSALRLDEPDDVQNTKLPLPSFPNLLKTIAMGMQRPSR